MKVQDRCFVVLVLEKLDPKGHVPGYQPKCRTPIRKRRCQSGHHRVSPHATISSPRSNKSKTSIDGKKVDTVVEEIKSIGGEAIGTPGDVAADDFPKKIIGATIQ